MTLPLADLRVLDVATFLAAPFCGTILADFGAEMIKVEQPGIGDSLRRFGTPSDCGDTFMWLSEGRNRKSITLDLRQERGADLFRQLVAKSDIVLENFRPGTMDRWGIGYDALKEINPRLVMLSVSAYGQDGPYRSMPGFARIAHAFSGLAYLAGEPGKTPVVPGSTSLADYMSGLFGAIGVLIARREAEKTGIGQRVDVGLYESVFRVLDELAPVYANRGVKRERMGADTLNIVPHSHYQARDGGWVAIACSNDRMWQRLTKAMGRPELATASYCATMRARDEHRAEVNAIVAEWVGSLSADEVVEACRKEDMPCSKLLSIEDIFSDPQYSARENLLKVEDSRIGELVLPAPVPRLSRTPRRPVKEGPALGDANAEIYSGLLGISCAELDELRQQQII